MKTLSVLIGCSLCLVSCQKREEVTAAETRRVTMRDGGLKLNATNEERFGAAGRPREMTAPVAAGDAPVVAGMLPEGWTEAPGTSMRLLNYRFGSSGEVYFTVSRGGVPDNVNRWLRQFGREALDEAGIGALPKAELAGAKGVWVEAEGDYAAGMGQEPRAGYGLYGVVAAADGEILTVKMVGPAAEVTAEKEKLREFVAALKGVK